MALNASGSRSPDRAAERAQLFPREPLGIDQPADQYVSVEKGRGQTVALIPGGDFQQLGSIGG